MVEEAQQWAVPAAAWLLTYLIHSTLLIAAVWLISRRLQGRPAALDALWKTALVGGLVTATLQTAAGVSPLGGRLDLVAGAIEAPALDPEEKVAKVEKVEKASAPRLHWSPLTFDSASARRDAQESNEPAPSTGRVAESGSQSSTMSEMGSTSSTRSQVESGMDPEAGSVAREPGAVVGALAGSGPGVASEAGAAAGPGPAGAGSVPAAGSASASVSASNDRWASAGLWLTAAFISWIALAGFLGFGLIRQWRALRRLLSDRRRIQAGPARTMLAELSADSRRCRRVRLSASPRVDVPIAVGVFRPEIVVPERALYALQPAELESMLAHELAHLVRRDPLWRLIAGFLHRVMFLQPLNRVAAHNLENASEMLCDDWAIERTDHPLALARCLTEVAAWVATPLGASVPAMARHGSGLGRRVRRLIAAGDAPLFRRRDRWPIPLAGGALALVVFAAPGATEMTGSSSLAPLPYASTKLASTTPPTEGLRGGKLAVKPGPTAEPVAPAEPEPAARQAGDARRLLEGLRDGASGKHDISDWVALAQLLGSGKRADVEAMLQSSSGADPLAAGGVPVISPDDIEDLIEGAFSQALATSGIDVDVDFDIDVDTEDGGIDIHINGLDIRGLNGGDDSTHFELDFNLDVPEVEVEVEVPEVPEPPESPDAPEPPAMMSPPDVPDPPATPTPSDPPDPPEPQSDCDSQHDQDHHARELRRQALEVARVAREQARMGREQARRALAQARNAMREQARHMERHARAQARAVEEQARQIRHQFREQVRMAAQARRDAWRERNRQHEEALRHLKQVERDRRHRLRDMHRELRRQQEQLEQQQHDRERERERQQREVERQQRERERQQRESL